MRMTAGYSEQVTGVLPSQAATPGPCAVKYNTDIN